MTRFTFGTKAEADQVRQEYAGVLHENDDNREKTVRFNDDLPDDEAGDLQARADASKTTQEAGPGHEELTDAEKGRVGPFDPPQGGPNQYRKATAVKAIAAEKGVDDWTAYYDPSLTPSEHYEVMERAAREEGGQRMDAERSDARRAADLEQQASGECDHAHDHCKHGDPEACEYLTDTCDFEEDEVAGILQADPTPSEGDGEGGQEGGQTSLRGLTGGQKGALRRAWNGYKAAVATLDRELGDVAEAFANAERAAAAIHAIESNAEALDTEEFRRLAEHHATLRELCDQHRGATHGQPSEDTPLSTDAGRLSDSDLAAREPDRPDDPIPDRPEALEAEGDPTPGEGGRGGDPTPAEGGPTRRKSAEQRDLEGESAAEAQTEFVDAPGDPSGDSEHLVEEASAFGQDDRSDPSRGAGSDAGGGDQATIGESTGKTDVPEAGQEGLGTYDDDRETLLGKHHDS